MQQVRDPRGNRRTSRQQVTGRNPPNDLMERDMLRQEVHKLNEQLGRERANFFREKNWRIELHHELDDTRQQLNKQKTLKEMYINREKETRRELERLQKYSDADTLSTAKIASQVRDATRQKTKKVLHRDYEELQVAHVISLEKLTAELQTEREKSKLLQEELEKITVSHHQASQKYECDVLTARQQADSLQRELNNARKTHADRAAEDQHLIQNLRAEQEALSQRMAEVIEDIQRYECDVLTARQQADSLQRELDNVRKTHADRAAEDQHLMQNLRAEQEALRQRMAEEIDILQRNTSEKEAGFGRELEELKTELNNQISLNLKLSTEREAEREDYQPPRRKIAKREHQFHKQEETLAHAPAPTPLEEAEVAEKKPCEPEETLPHAPAPTPLEEAEVAEKKPCEPEETLPHAPAPTPLEEAEVAEKKPCEQEETLPHAPALTPLLEEAEVSKEKPCEPEETLPDPPALTPLLEEAEVTEKKPCEQEETLPNPPALTLPKEPEVSEEKLPEKPKKMSVWKRTRHFLGLWKPQKWKGSTNN